MWLRNALLASLVTLLLPAVAGAEFIIVTSTGAQIVARSAPRIDGQLVRFHSMGGTPLVMRAVNLDIDATERINDVELAVKVRRAEEEEITGPMFLGIPVPRSPRASSAETITNADLRQVRNRRSVFAETGSEIPAPGNQNQIQAREPDERPSLNRNDWETRAGTIRARQRELVRRRNNLTSEVQRLERGMMGLDAAQTQRLGARLDEVRSELRQVESELSSVESQWTQLQREARQSGVPSEWIQ